MRATIHTTAVAAEVMDAGKLADKDRPAHSTGGRDRPGPGGERQDRLRSQWAPPRRRWMTTDCVRTVMALFGAPRAHDDDPLRAARAALDIHEALAWLSESAGRPRPQFMNLSPSC